MLSRHSQHNYVAQKSIGPDHQGSQWVQAHRLGWHKNHPRTYTAKPFLSDFSVGVSETSAPDII